MTLKQTLAVALLALAGLSLNTSAAEPAADVFRSVVTAETLDLANTAEFPTNPELAALDVTKRQAFFLSLLWTIGDGPTDNGLSACQRLLDGCQLAAQGAVRLETGGEALELKSDRCPASHTQHRGGLALSQAGPTTQQTGGYASHIRVPMSLLQRRRCHAQGA